MSPPPPPPRVLRLPVRYIVEGAIDAASNKRAKADDIPSLLGTYFAKLILSAHKHCLNETEPWWEAKNDVVVRDFAADLPTSETSLQTCRPTR